MGEANVVYSPVLLPPESLIRAHTLPLKRVELARLEKHLAEVQAVNDTLLRTVDVQRGEIDTLNKSMRDGMEDLEQAVGSCSAIPLGEMRESMEELIPTLLV
jgi:Nnf1